MHRKQNSSIVMLIINTAKRIALATVVVCSTACTTSINLIGVLLIYDGDRLDTIEIQAAHSTLDTISKRSAMYVSIFPCGRDSMAVFYPIIQGEARPLGRTLLVDVKSGEPQPEFGYQLCAQVVADGMSFEHYVSNVVRARRAEQPKSR